MKCAIQKDIERYFIEDDINRNLFYSGSLPCDEVECTLKIKDNIVLSGVPWFIETFRYLGAEKFFGESIEKLEGTNLSKGLDIDLGRLPFSIALTGERIALNLLQKSSSISTFTKEFVEKADALNIKILDTRKTTPGMRSLEKYAVRQGGGYNHRMGQTDMWMIKDNHKTFFGGVEKAFEFFTSMKSFYCPVELEVHNITELKEGLELGIKHFMLDNFSPEQINTALEYKKDAITFEVSGGIRLENIDQYLIGGVDVISIGALTYGAPAVDLSFKFKKLR